MQRDLSAFSSNHPKLGHSALSVQALLERWQLFCEKPPKGFEKYYKDTKDKASPDEAAKSPKDGSEKKAADSAPSSKAAPMSKPPGADLKASKSSDWNFGMFSPTNKSGGTGGSGRPIGGGDGNGDREKWLLLGALGVAGFLGLIAFMEMNYKEIGWKEFVNT